MTIKEVFMVSMMSQKKINDLKSADNLIRLIYR
jgi:hypothetical protein